MKIKAIICAFKGHEIDPEESITQTQDIRNYLCKCKRCGLYEMHDALTNTSITISEKEAYRFKEEFESEMEMLKGLWNPDCSNLDNIKVVSTAEHAAMHRFKAEPQVRTEMSLADDLISRERLLKDLRSLVEAWSEYSHMAAAIKGVEVAIKYVENIPPAD